MHKRPVTAGLALALVSVACAGRQTADPLQTWIVKQAVPMRSLDAADEDFSDLEPLMHAIGNANVVSLGEISHGAGTHLAAKVRLVKFLHQRMGFDVLVWEAGLTSVPYTEAALRAGEDPVDAGLIGVFPVWSRVEEVRPLFQYAQATRGTSQLLQMAGFDVQFSGRGGVEDRLNAEMHRFFEALPDAGLRSRALEAVDGAWQRYFRFPAVAAQREKSAEVKPADLAGFQAAIETLLELMKTRRALLLQIHGARATDFMRQAVENLGQNGVLDSEPDTVPPSVTARSWNLRDSQNARNVRWLLEEHYRGHKLILWAHNAHLMNAYYSADRRTMHDKPQPDGQVPTGTYLAKWFGDAIYTIGFTAFDGNDKDLRTGKSVPVPPATAGSLEERLHRLGKPYLFLDMRAVDGVPEHPLHQLQSMRIRHVTEPYTLPDLTKVYDGIFFVDRLMPSVRIQGK